MKNKEKYDLRELRIIIVRSCIINFCSLKIIHKKRKIFERIGIGDHEIFNEIFEWLEQDCSILDEKEKEYLSAVIRPWRDKVIAIIKTRECEIEKKNTEFIRIRLDDIDTVTDLPYFEAGSMYKGMELDREYSLEDLGI